MSMSAKELLKFIGPVESGSKWEFCAEHQATILRALSLLAAVEDGDEIVRYLNKDAARLLAKSKQVPSTAGQMKYEEISRKQANAAARITQDAQEKAALKAKLASVKAELERTQERAQSWRDRTHEAEDVACEALASFKVTQSIYDYPEGHWSHKAECIRVIRSALPQEGA